MGNDFGLSSTALARIREIIHGFPDIQEVFVFGSRAMGNWKNGSDIDIALMDDTVSPDTVRALSRAFDENDYLPWKFDVVAFHQIENEDLKRHILTEGRSLWK